MSEWPKPWSEIRPNPPENQVVWRAQYEWVEYQDGLRGCDGTLYANVDLGSETDENRDLWLPFDEYIDRKL